MNETPALKRTELFGSTSEEDIDSMLGCLGSHVRTYQSGEYVFHMGDMTSEIGLVLEGSVYIENVDIWGDARVMRTCSTGELFCEEQAAIPNEPLMVDVIAQEDSRIMFLNASKVLSTCPHACPHHRHLSLKLTTMIARRSLGLSQQLFHTTPKSIRGKLLSYLSHESERAGSNEFDIPFNRQQLANYLGIDRSAMSNEISKMRDDGILETKRSHFKLNERAFQ